MKKKASKPRYKELEKKLKQSERTLSFYKENIISFLQNLQEKKMDLLGLKRDNERLLTIMNSIDAVVYVSDMDTYELLFTNKYFDTLFGKNKTGQKCYSVLQGKSQKCDFCTNCYLVDEKGAPNQCYVWEFQNLITQKWFQCHDQAICWSDGRIVRLEVANDITKLKEYEQKLEVSEKKLRELNSTKDKFFSIIAHDLKNPFSVLQSGAELLSIYLEKNNLAKAKSKSQIISEATKQVNVLLENLLEWARSQTDALFFNPQNFIFKIFVSECIEEVKDLAGNKAISIFNEIPPEMKLFADKNLLSVVLRNLLTNAIKFTHKRGNISVKVRNEEEESEITVMDTGIGIAKDHQDKLFRMDAHYTRFGTASETGTSLGLILCKEFVEKHGGKIWVESDIDKGSEFKFPIPLNKKNHTIPLNSPAPVHLSQTTLEFPK